MLEAARTRISDRFDRLLAVLGDEPALLGDERTSEERSAEASTGEQSHTERRAA